MIECQQELKQLKESGGLLCSQSMAFLQADLSLKAVSDRYRPILENLSSTDCVTALSVIRCNAIETDQSTPLLVGTESRSLILLDAADSAIETQWKLDSPPSAIRTSGFMNGTSMIVVVGRDRTVQLISNKSDNNSIRCESLPIDAAIVGEYIYVALMSKVVKIFDSVCKVVGTIAFDTHIISLVAVDIANRQLPCCCVATGNGDLTFISRTERLLSINLEEGISALHFGIVGREPYNLLSISKHGGLFLRTLSRIVLPEEPKNADAGEAVPPIPIPKKTKLYVDKCEAERAGHKEMYQKWRDSIRYLTLLAANTYAQILDDSVVSPMENITFTVKVLGMGPDFVMNVTTVNSGKEPIAQVKLISRYNPKIYRIAPPFIDMPTLIGGCSYTARFVVTSIDRDGKSDVVNLIAICPEYTIPLCSSIVQIPVSQFPVND
jgi:Bardet-Biedl syndrome 1 protein